MNQLNLEILFCQRINKDCESFIGEFGELGVELKSFSIFTLLYGIGCLFFLLVINLFEFVDDVKSFLVLIFLL